MGVLLVLFLAARILREVIVRDFERKDLEDETWGVRCTVHPHIRGTFLGRRGLELCSDGKPSLLQNDVYTSLRVPGGKKE